MRWRRHHPTPAPAPRANPLRTELLEYALNGTEPAPDSWAATVLAMSRAGTCLSHAPIDTSRPGEPTGSRGVCEKCWRPMVLGDTGGWRLVP